MNRLLAALFAGALVLVAVEPGRVPLFEPDEGRYAEIPREMLASGDFVTPRLNGVLYFEKPPLHYWSVALCFELLGQTELAARIPSKVASVGMALLAFLFARGRYGERTGLLAGLITASCAIVVSHAHLNLIDPSLSFALTGAVFAFAAFQEAEAEGDARRARRALYILHAACAAAVLLKGLVGLVLPGGAILVWAAFTGRWRVVPRLFAPGPLALFLALAVPWHVLAARRNPDFLNFYFVHEHFVRFSGHEHKREQPFWIFVPILVGGLLPWTAFLGRLRHSVPLRPAAMRERPTEAYLAIFSALVFLFFSASNSKLVPYILPIVPSVAVLLAAGIERGERSLTASRVERVLLAVFFGLLLTALLGYAVAGGFVRQFGIAPGAAVLAIGAAAGFVAALGTGRRADGAVVAGAPWLVVLAGLILALPGVARSVTPWPLVTALRAELGRDDVLLQHGHYLEVIPFYVKRLTPISNLGWSELDFGRAHPHPPGLFPTDEEFARLWTGGTRVLDLVHRGLLVRFTRADLEPSQFRVLARSPNEKVYLVENRPRR